MKVNTKLKNFHFIKKKSENKIIYTREKIKFNTKILYCLIFRMHYLQNICF